MVLSLRRSISQWFAPPPFRAQGESLYAAALTRSRTPALFAEFGVPDSLDGRFDSLALHVALLVRRIRREPDGAALIQALYDAMFDDLDRSLREMGVGDLGVGKRVQRMAEGLMGRVVAYDAGLAAPTDDALEAAIRRNLYGTVATPAADHVAALAHAMRRSDERLAAQALADMIETGPAFASIAQVR